jgi:hypothetical protein
MLGSSWNRTNASTWVRLGLTTVALAATAVLSSGCVPTMYAIVVAPIPPV